MTERALVEYRFNDGTYVVTIPAASWSEADARLNAIRKTGRVIGWPSFGNRANSVTLPFAALMARFRAWLWTIRKGKRP